MDVKGRSVRTKPLSLGRARLALILAVAASAIALVAPGSASAACPGGASPYATAVTANASLLGYWRLDDTSPSSTACATKGPVGSYNGGFTLGASPGATSAADTDTAVTLDGTSAYVSVVDDGTLNPSGFTVEAWVRPGVVTGSQAVVRKDGEFYVKIFDGKLQGWLWTNPTTRVTVTSTAAVVVANQWQQVAMTYNGTTATLYRNGASVGSAALTATVTPSANPLRWGDAFTNNLDQNFLTGWLDEPAIYGSALSATEINNHYKAATTTPVTPPAAPQGLGATGGQGQVSLTWSASSGATSYNVYRGTSANGEAATPVKTGVTSTSYTDTGLANSTQYFYKVTAVGTGGEGGPSAEANATTNPPVAGCAPNTSTYSTSITGNASLVGYWRLGDASGSTTACASKGPDGTYGGGASPGAAGGISNDPDTAVGLNGTSAFVEIPNAAALNPTRLTVEAWVKPTTTGGSQAIVRKDGQYYLKIYNGQLQAWLWTSATAHSDATSTAAGLVAGQWQHVAMTYDGTAVRIYRNGVQVASTSKSGATIPSTTNVLHWGDTRISGAEGNWLGGNLDEVAVYNAALSAATLATHYQAGIAPPSKPAAPTGLQATGGSGQIALTWNASTGATTYNIYRTAANGSTLGTTPIKTGVTGTSYTDTGLPADTAYSYAVTAVNTAGESGQSNVAPARTAVAGTAGLVALWHMDERSGTVMNDSVGTHNGTLHSVTLGQTGWSSFGYSFNGSSSYVEVPNSADLNPGSKNITITIHMKTPNLPPSTVQDWDVMRKGLYTDGAEFKMEYYPTGQLGCAFLGTGAYTDEHPAGPMLNDNVWHTLTCVKTSTGMDTIVDGETVYHQTVVIGSIVVNVPIEIGARPGSEYFKGLLDEASIKIG